MIEQPSTFRESDMDAPVRAYFVTRGFTVQSEVLHCDMVAVQGETCIVIEFKKSLNMKVLLQACERQTRADEVYIAVPRPKRYGPRTAWPKIISILRRLELGLMFVSLDSPAPEAIVIAFPEAPAIRKQSAKRRALLSEIARRRGDYNQAGSTGRPIVTAYREEAVFIAVALEQLGQSSPKTLCALSTPKNTASILRSNVYGWFQRVDRGLYRLTQEGEHALKTYEQLANVYRKQLLEQFPAGR